MGIFEAANVINIFNRHVFALKKVKLKLYITFYCLIFQVLIFSFNSPKILFFLITNID